MSHQKKINIDKSKPVVLLAPLDWGLGHTTRCIPIIGELLKLSCSVIVACNSVQKRILATEFPELQFVHLEGYNLKYSHNRLLTIASIILQVPKILTRIKSEAGWIRAFVSNHKVDAVISDNRYGFCTSGIRSVFITHQLSVKTGAGRIADQFVNKVLHGYINCFSECWVPDFATNALAAGLSTPQTLLRVPVKHIGSLSRFTACAALPENNFILIILSGPEPQRSIFEDLILKQLPVEGKRVMLVRGHPASGDDVKHQKGLEVAGHLPAARLNEMICKADLVISRSGYTTIMDLVKLKKKMVLVPTPGQKEQEHLAEHFQIKKFALCFEQESFSLQNAIEMAERFEFIHPDFDMDEYKNVVAGFVKKLEVMLNVE